MNVICQARCFSDVGRILFENDRGQIVNALGDAFCGVCFIFLWEFIRECSYWLVSPTRLVGHLAQWMRLQEACIGAMDFDRWIVGNGRRERRRRITTAVGKCLQVLHFFFWQGLMTQNWYVLVCRELTSDDELGEARSRLKTKEWGAGKIFQDVVAITNGL